RKPLFDSLSPAELETLKLIFLRDMPQFDDRNSVLLITQPLYEDGIVLSETEQMEIYQKLAAKYTEGYSLVIKPHPRDKADYSAAFPKAVIIDSNMPLEIIALIHKPEFRCVISLNSSSERVIKADSYVNAASKTTG
ncbi:MAG: glycosyltransferase family 52, partial [Oscillospiraceae bacterium]